MPNPTSEPLISNCGHAFTGRTRMCSASQEAAQAGNSDSNVKPGL